MADRLVHDRFRLLERHAVGGMSTIWRAKDERSGEVVALKLLHPYLIRDPVARARLNREADALRALDHPAIVQPRELIDDADSPALVMEFAPGRSLAERLAEDGPLEPDEATAIAAIVADALAVAHRAGVVHRDVKPANILVEDSGAVHLVDFGIAKDADASDVALTADRTVVGSLRYMAPERRAGAAATPRSDVWALGLVLHEMVAGPLATPGEASDQIPPSIAAVIRRATAHDPLDRYPDADAFRRALEAIDHVDPDGETAVIPIAPGIGAPGGPVSPGESSTVPSLGSVARLSPVDRAASVFFGGVVLVMLVAAVALGLGGDGSSPRADATPLPSVDATPDVRDVVATPVPEDDDRGKGNGRGRGNGKGKGKDDAED